MLELEKMIQNGLQLNYAYMISKQNYACKEWVKILNKKRKAINSGNFYLIKILFWENRKISSKKQFMIKVISQSMYF